MNFNTCVPSHPELNFNSWPRDPLLCLPACLCVHKTVCLSVSLSACLFDRMPVCLYLSVCLVVCLSVQLSVCLVVCLSIFLFVCLVVRQSSCLSVRLSVCVSVTPETVDSGQKELGCKKLSPVTHTLYAFNIENVLRTCLYHSTYTIARMVSGKDSGIGSEHTTLCNCGTFQSCTYVTSAG